VQAEAGYYCFAAAGTAEGHQVLDASR
jgi:hypothetical protein